MRPLSDLTPLPPSPTGEGGDLPDEGRDAPWLRHCEEERRSNPENQLPWIATAYGLANLRFDDAKRVNDVESVTPLHVGEGPGVRSKSLSTIFFVDKKEKLVFLHKDIEVKNNYPTE